MYAIDIPNKLKGNYAGCVELIVEFNTALNCYLNMTEPTYTVELINNIVVAKVSGDWNIQADIGYLTTLDETISRVRNDRWALFADLRGWRVSEDVVNFKHNLTIELARNNQQAECWLVDNMDQGKHIQHHIENVGVPLYKCVSREDAEKWLMQNGFYL